MRLSNALIAVPALVAADAFDSIRDDFTTIAPTDTAAFQGWLTSYASIASDHYESVYANLNSQYIPPAKMSLLKSIKDDKISRLTVDYDYSDFKEQFTTDTDDETRRSQTQNDDHETHNHDDQETHTHDNNQQTQNSQTHHNQHSRASSSSAIVAATATSSNMIAASTSSSAGTLSSTGSPSVASTSSRISAISGSVTASTSSAASSSSAAAGTSSSSVAMGSHQAPLIIGAALAGLSMLLL